MAPKQMAGRAHAVTLNAAAQFSLANFIQATIGKFKCQNAKINIK